MNQPQAMPIEIVDLIFRESEGTLTAEQALQLGNWLTVCDDHRASYVEMLSLLSGLEWERGAGAMASAGASRRQEEAGIVIPGLVPAVAGPRLSRTPVLGFPGGTNVNLLRHSWLSILLIGVLYYGAVTVLFWGIGSPVNRQAVNLATREDGSEVSPPDELPRILPPGMLATIVSAADCEWRQAPPSQLKEQDRLELIRGTAQLLFASGATVDLLGPAELQIQSVGAGFLQRGKLTAMVPHRARGFTIDTPTLRVVDLGTEFGVEVQESGHAEVHVFQGSVDACQLVDEVPGPSTRLVAGEAVRVETESSEPVRFSATPGRFAASEVKQPKYQLLGFYPFDGNAQDASGSAAHATKVSNVSFVEGHEGKAALFKGDSSSFIELPIDASADTLPDMTWGAWVKPAAEINSRGEILSTDDTGYDRILTIDDRRGVVSEKDLGFAAMAGPQVGVLMSQGPRPVADRWTFLAAVYRSESQTVALYVEDPQLAGGRGGLVSDIAGNVQIGPSLRTVRVGCHTNGTEAFAGAIDNVFLISGAMSHEQLEEIRTDGVAAVKHYTVQANSTGQSTHSSR